MKTQPTNQIVFTQTMKTEPTNQIVFIQTMKTPQTNKNRLCLAGIDQAPFQRG